MKLKFPDEKYIFDGAGDELYIASIKNIHTLLTQEGYSNSMDLARSGKKFYIKTSLLSEFVEIENSGEIDHNDSKKFNLIYRYWYNPELDMYISFKKSIIHHYGYEEDLDEDDILEEEMVKVTSIYYRYENVQAIIEYLNDNIIDNVPSDNKIEIIVQNQSGFDFIEHSIKPTEVDIDTMYNDDFADVYDHIVDKLNTADKGIVLFHGDPGTGKTTLIRHLTTVVNKKFIFVPINMIGHISSPSFIQDLVTNKGNVLVIEDCENFIQDRSISENSIVSSLLQVTDGILSDILSLKVICTFNTDITRVDPALMREGRLIAEYKFEQLSQEKADKLAGEPVEGPRTLSNIFNELTYTQNKKVEQTIGFGK